MNAQPNSPEHLDDTVGLKETKLRHTLDTIPAMVWIASPEGEAIFVNRGWTEYFGLSLQDVRGRGWARTVHPDDVGPFVAKWRASLATGQPLEEEVRFRRADGEYRWFLIRGVPACGEGGKIVNWYNLGTDITERKQAEQALRRAEKELRDLVENMPAMAGVLLPDGSHPFLTNQWREYTGMSVAETDSEGPRRVVHPEDINLHIEKLRAAAAAGQPFENELRLRRAADGEYRWFLVRMKPSRDEHGNVVKWHGVLTDIEDRKRAEQELRDVIETMPTMVWIARTDGSDEFGNRYWEEYAGLSHERTVGSGWQDAVHPADLKGHLEKWCASLASGKPFESEVRYRRAADGQYRWFLSRAVPLRDVKGEIVKWYGVSTDIEDRKHAEEALRRSEAYLAEGQRLTHTGSWALNVVTGQALHSSAEHTRMFGFDPEEGMPSFEDFLQRVHPEDQEHVLETFQALTRSGGDLDLRYRIELPGGPVRYMHAIGHPVLKQSGTTGEYVGITIDITERRRLEQEREKLRKLEAELVHMNRVSTMGEMAASLAHEVKQPISAAVMNAEVCLELLQREQPYIPDLTDATSAMLRSAKRAADIIDSVRSLTRRGTPKREVVVVNDVIREIDALLQNQARQHSVGVHLQLKENVPCIAGDRVQLQQVVMNLMLNAIEAMNDAGGELVVKSELTDAGYVIISVSDTGVGLPKENEGQIFEAFFTTKSHGSGMGLAISRSIVESHGGRLWATGNPGRGATFYVQLPRQVAEPA
jgi:PAS domain S-box-containing protein